jgi:NDP-sugar pyrophosphorylase family protein
MEYRTTKPKTLLEVSGKPLIHHIISRLPEVVDEIIMVVGHLGQQIVDYCGNEFMGRKMRYVWQEKKLGTYHALKICEPYIQKGERFFLLLGNSAPFRDIYNT